MPQEKRQSWCKMGDGNRRYPKKDICTQHWREYVAEHWRQDDSLITRANFKSEYSIWVLMLWRCNDPTAAPYKYYGARGIKVCDEWQRSFKAFIKDIGPRPDPWLSIDRIDNDGNYEPGNVRWATRSQQYYNSRLYLGYN